MPGIEVLSKTQRIIVLPNTSVSIVKEGPTGPIGPIGPVGPPGPPGPQGDQGPNVIAKCLGVAESLVGWGPENVYSVDASGAIPIPGLVVNAVVGYLPIVVQCHLPAIDLSEVAGTVAVQFYDETEDLILYESVWSIAAFTYVVPSVRARIDFLEPGLHTIRVRVWSSYNGAKFNLAGSSSFRSQLTIDEVAAAPAPAVPRCLGVAESLVAWGPVDVGPTEADALQIPGLSVTADIDELPIVIECYLPAVDLSDVGGLFAVNIYDETDDVVLISSVWTIAPASYVVPSLRVRVEDLDPGEHVIKVLAWTNVNANKLNIAGSSVFRQQLIVDEVAATPLS